MGARVGGRSFWNALEPPKTLTHTTDSFNESNAEVVSSVVQKGGITSYPPPPHSSNLSMRGCKYLFMHTPIHT